MSCRSAGTAYLRRAFDRVPQRRACACGRSSSYHRRPGEPQIFSLGLSLSCCGRHRSAGTVRVCDRCLMLAIRGRLLTPEALPLRAEILARVAACYKGLSADAEAGR